MTHMTDFTFHISLSIIYKYFYSNEESPMIKCKVVGDYEILSFSNSFKENHLKIFLTTNIILPMYTVILWEYNMEPPSWSDMSRMIHMYLLMTNKHLTHSAAVSWPVIPWLFYNNSCSEAFHKIYAVVLRGQCWDYILIQTVGIYAGYYLTRHKRNYFVWKGN